MTPTPDPKVKPAAAVPVNERIKDLKKRLEGASKDLDSARAKLSAAKVTHDAAVAKDSETRKLILASAEEVKKTRHAYEMVFDEVGNAQRAVHKLEGEMAAIAPPAQPTKK